MRTFGSLRLWMVTAMAAAMAPLVIASDPSAAAPASVAGIDYAYIPIFVPSNHGRATAVSNDRTVVGFYIDRAAIELPFVWDETNDERSLVLSDTSQRHGAATAISPDGSTIVGWEESTTGDCWAVRWRKDANSLWQIQKLLQYPQKMDLNIVGCSYEPAAVGDDGVVVINNLAGTSGFQWKDGTVTALAGQPFARSSTGEVVGSVGGVGTAKQPWRESGAAVPLPYALTSGQINGIGRDGTMIVSGVDFADGSFQRQPNGGYLPLESLTHVGVDKDTKAFAISDHDEVVGVSNGPDDIPRAVRWNSDGTVVDLNTVTNLDPGTQLLAARGVNKDGDIVGGAAETGSYEIPYLLKAKPPIIFVPGVAGSHLVDDSGMEHWLGCGSDHDDLALNPDGTPNSSIHADDVLRNQTCFGLSNNDTLAYGPFIQALKQDGGMVEYDEAKTSARWTTAGCDTSQRSRHPNLFLLPYDWRQSNAETAQQLSDLMGCVRKFYTGPVVIAAHSMGSLVSRRYILDHPDDTHHVRNLVTIGAPWLGAPKLVNAELTGSFVPIVSDAAIRRILPTMPGPGQLLPSSAYYDLDRDVFGEKGVDVNGDGIDSDWLTPEQLDAYLDTLSAGHSAITAQANAFHAFTTAEGAQDDWRTDKTDVDYTVLYGVHAQRDTIGQVSATSSALCRTVLSDAMCQVTARFDQALTDGDGTVPLTSSTRTNGWLDLNNADHEKLIPIYGSQWGEDLTEHTGLTRNPLVQQWVLGEDGRGSVPTAPATSAVRAAASTDPKAIQWNAQVVGAQGAVAITGPDGTTDTNADGLIIAPLTGVSHIGQAAGAELDVVPGAGQYTLSFRAGTAPPLVDLRQGDRNSPAQRVQWTDLQVPKGTLVTVTVDGSTAALSYDSDADGSADQPIAPTLTRSGGTIVVNPPTVTASAVQHGSSRTIVLTAASALSTVTRLMWSADAHTFHPYSGEITPGPGVSTLYAFAEDAAGNRSAVQQIDVATLATGPYVTMTAVPAPTSDGWSQHPYTAYLQAHASSERTIDSIVWVYTSRAGMQFQNVTGATATVPIDQDGPGTLLYWTVDSAGAQSRPITQAVNVDESPPVLVISSPADGRTVNGLPFIYGSAVDPESGNTGVSVTLQRDSDNLYWTGSAWQVARATLQVSGSSPWTVADPLPHGAQLPVGAYSVQVQAGNRAGASTVVASNFVVSAELGSDNASIRALAAPAAYSDLTTSGFAINNNGQVAGVLSPQTLGPCSNWYQRPVRWAADGTPQLLNSTCWSGHVWAINDSGVVVGDSYPNATSWAADGTEHPLPLNPWDQNVRTTGYAVTNGGTVVGSLGGSMQPGWMIWSGGPDTSLGQVPGFSVPIDTIYSRTMREVAINDAGTIVATLFDGDPYDDARGIGPRAVIKTDAGGRLLLGDTVNGAPATYSGATAINQAGDIVGWGGVQTAPGTGGFTQYPPFLRKADGTMQWFDLASIGLNCAIPMSVSRTDVIVGIGTADGCPIQPSAETDVYNTYLPEWLPYTAGTHRAFIIDHGVAKDLNSLLPPDSGWVLTDAWGVNDNNQIVGNGLLDGRAAGFVLTFDVPTQQAAPPALLSPTVSTAPGRPMTITLASGTTAQQPLTWSTPTAPAHGALAGASGGAVTYTPEPGFEGTDTFTVQADNGTYRSNVATVTVDVHVAGPDAAELPVAVIVGAAAVTEGGSIDLDASDSVDPGGAPLAYAWDLDGDGVFGDSVAPTVAVATPPIGPLTVSVRVTGGKGTAEVSHLVTVENVAPAVTGLADGIARTGESVPLAGTFTDPGQETWTVTASVDDGTATPLAVDGMSFYGSVVFAAPGAHTLTVQACDDNGGCGAQTVEYAVTGSSTGSGSPSPSAPATSSTVPSGSPSITPPAVPPTSGGAAVSRPVSVQPSTTAGAGAVPRSAPETTGSPVVTAAAVPTDTGRPTRSGSPSGPADPATPAGQAAAEAHRGHPFGWPHWAVWLAIGVPVAASAFGGGYLIRRVRGGRA